MWKRLKCAPERGETSVKYVALVTEQSKNDCPEFTIGSKICFLKIQSYKEA